MICLDLLEEIQSLGPVVGPKSPLNLKTISNIFVSPLPTGFLGNNKPLELAWTKAFSLSFPTKDYEHLVPQNGQPVLALAFLSRKNNKNKLSKVT